MQIENAFDIDAPPQQVFEFLLDVNSVARCVPGTELTEVVDPSTFKGRVKIKVGPITVAYAGTARIASRNDDRRTAVLEAEGRETTGPGSARATATMVVAAAGDGSNVRITTDFTVAGRVAQFGRGVMEDVSRRLVSQMAACVKEQLEGSRVSPTEASAPTGTGNPTPTLPPGGEATPVNALSLLWSVLLARLRRLFSRR